MRRGSVPAWLAVRLFRHGTARCRALEDELTASRVELTLRKTQWLGKSDLDLLMLIVNRQSEPYWHVCRSESERRRTA
jgi:hypothetical protein